MKKTIAILSVALAVSATAEEFNWAWEKKGKAPSEQQGDHAKGVTSPAKGVTSPAKGVTSPAEGVTSPAEGVTSLAGDMTNDVKAAATQPAAVVKTSTDGSVPDASDKSLTAGLADKPSEGSFSWEWEKGEGGKRAEDSIQHPVSSSQNEGKETTGQPVTGIQLPDNRETQQPATSSRAGEKTVDAKAYEELINENLALRKKMEEVKQDKDLVKQENEKLAKEVRDLEQKISDSVTQIKELGRQKEDSLKSPDKVKDLELKLGAVEQEKTRLGNELSVLQKKIADQVDVRIVPPAETAGAGMPAQNKPLEPVKTGSDLYNKVESENQLLRRKLAEIETERQMAVKAGAEKEKKEKIAAEEARRATEAQKLIQGKLDEAKSVEKKQKKLMTDLAERIPDMESELTAMQKKISEKDAALKAKDQNLEALAREVEQRENRIRKAERMVSLMDQAQKDVNEVSDSEKRDMHYNMAAVYAQVGRAKDAEREYLHALRIDPTDADVHYNLGILYDESFHDKQKAAMHYRRYLKLRPSGPDVDAVKNWLITLDMK